MSRSAPPDESDLLCEFCGYILNGLEKTGATNCPECGQPLAASVQAGQRQPAAIERGPGGFWRTTRDVLIRKRKFFRGTLSRPDSPGVDAARVRRFGMIHRVIAGVLFGLAATAHLAWMSETRGWTFRWTAGEIALIAASAPFFIGFCILALTWLTRLAVRLTTTESRFWGMRLPRGVVERAMDFHAANYLPIGIVAVLLTVGFRVALITGLLTAIAGVPYLVVLCAAVVAGAVWLFESFVIAMRRIRYANF